MKGLGAGDTRRHPITDGTVRGPRADNWICIPAPTSPVSLDTPEIPWFGSGISRHPECCSLPAKPLDTAGGFPTFPVRRASEPAGQLGRSFLAPPSYSREVPYSASNRRYDCFPACPVASRPSKLETCLYNGTWRTRDHPKPSRRPGANAPGWRATAH